MEQILKNHYAAILACVIILYYIGFFNADIFIKTLPRFYVFAEIVFALFISILLLYGFVMLINSSIKE